MILGERKRYTVIIDKAYKEIFHGMHARASWWWSEGMFVYRQKQGPDMSPGAWMAPYAAAN